MTDETPTYTQQTRDDGRRSFNPLLLLGAILIIFACIIGLFLVLANSDDPEDDPEAEVIQPVPAVVLTPLYDRIATLEADDSVDPEELQEIQRKIGELDETSIDRDELNEIIDDLDGQFIDGGELQEELDAFLVSEGFGESVLDVVNEANVQATQTQAAIDCFVQPLEEYALGGVRIREQPSQGAATVSSIEGENRYRVISRTEGDTTNSPDVWWQIMFDPTNDIRAWVRSDLVAESDVDKCLAIAVR